MDLFDYAEKKKKQQRENAPTRKSLPETKALIPESPSKEDVVWTVSELSGQVKLLMEGHFPSVAVEGEISTLKRAASGHVYFDLKDAQSVIKCVVWRSAAQYLPDGLKEGDAVIVTGKVTVYGAQSSYQIVIQKVRLAGIGTLMQQFEALKARLTTEGLFDAEHKKELPFLPQKVGIITSESGAVIEDMLTILRERFPVPVLFYSARVQGKGAAEEIVDGIHFFNALPLDEQPDVLIVGRGGGSLEDLWSFNEEVLVRAIFKSYIPIVSAVGHEPDVTLADYVADKRAPTPTAAAKMVVPERTVLMDHIYKLEQRLSRAMHVFLQSRHAELRYLSARLPKPQDTLGLLQQKTDEKEFRLKQSMVRYLETQKARFENNSLTRLHRAVKGVLFAEEERLMRFSQLLESYSPYSPLKRGYVYMTTASGAVLRSMHDGASGEDAQVHFADGKRTVTLGEPCND